MASRGIEEAHAITAVVSVDSYSRIGDNWVDTPVVCVLTRFGLRNRTDLLSTYRDYKRIVGDIRDSQLPGLFRSAFLVENLTTCHVASVWESYEAIPRFGTAIPSHVKAAGRVFGRCRRGANGGPELWSTKWRLISVSNNLNWSDFDLRGHLVASRAPRLSSHEASVQGV